METAGAVPDIAVDPGELADLYLQEGPVATVYLDTDPKVEQAAHRSAVRWRDLRTEMEGRGVPGGVLDAVDPVVADAHRHGAGMAVVAGPSGVRHVEHLARSPAADRGWWEGLPVLGHVLHERQAALPHLMVLGDREGADITSVTGSGVRRQEAAGAAGYPVHKVPSGGWSQTHNQRRVEGNWDTSARAVVEEVERLAAEVGAVVIVGAGDERALALIAEHLSPGWAGRFRPVTGGTGELERETHRLVADASARATVTALEEFRQQLSRHGRAVSGPEATVDAMHQGRVAVLLAHDSWDDDRRAWYSDAAGDVTLRASTSYPGEGRLVDVLMRAAFQTGAGVRLVPAGGGPEGGVGALLRWG